ncbi:MAG: hypothetical protein K2M95_06305 [Clostridiales bacterium]|nr:hypothetical protein [Clostridiales bacterium]
MDKHERIDAAFRCFCDYMDGEGLKYKAETKEGEDKRLLLGFMGDDRPLDAVFVFETEAERIYIGSLLPLKSRKETEDELLLAVLHANQLVAIGSFVLDTENGHISFESNETIAGVGAFEREYAERVIVSVFTVVKQFCGQFAAVIDGTLSASDITAESAEADGEEAQ